MSDIKFFFMGVFSLLLGFLFLFLFFLSVGAEAKVSLQKHPIYHRLINLQPGLDKDLAMDISNEIYRCHKKIGLDKFLITAIYNQESSINYKAKNCLKGILENKALDEIVDIVKKSISGGFIIDDKEIKKKLTNIPLKVCFDLGIGQINVNTALRYPECSDLKRLTTDYKYNIACSCKILEEFKSRLAHKDANWWTKYNANNTIKREIYRRLVMRYYPVKNKGGMNENIAQP